MATPLVQGRLRNQPLHCDVDSECACCTRPIRFRIGHDLDYVMDDPSCKPLFFVPMVDFTRLRAPSIIDDF